MSTCDRLEPGVLEQYFYGELPPMEGARVADHLRTCGTCRAYLDDVQAVSDTLARHPIVDAPPAGDWSTFMRRLDTATRPGSTARPRARLAPWIAGVAAALMIALVGAQIALRGVRPTSRRPVSVAEARVPTVQRGDTASRAALQAATAEHLERSKVVVLDLAMRDPHEKSAEWQDERRLAQGLLSDTRLYRLTAEQKGMVDVAQVMRDLETVLLEASMSDSRDPGALSRVQQLIAKRDLLMKMQVVSTARSSGT